MKKLFLLFMLAAIAMSGMAQTIGEAFYIYRNDGQFNAFFRDEVDSITYSNYDVDSIYYDDIVTQVVHTQDSIYRIPLAVIDSVGFHTPAYELQSNVVLMDYGQLGYLQNVNGMNLAFRSDMPNSLRPVVGNILISSDKDNTLFNQVFIGKVKSIGADDHSFYVECDSVSNLHEIFKRLIGIERYEFNNTTNNVKKRRASGQWISSRNPLEIELGLRKDFEAGELSLSGYFKDDYVVTATYIIDDDNQFMKFDLMNNIQLGFNLQFSVKKGDFGFIGPIVQSPAIWIPSTLPILYIQFAAAPFFKGKGTMELGYSSDSPIRRNLFTLINNNDDWKYYSHPISNQEGDDGRWSNNASFSLNGNVHAGGLLDITISTIPVLNSYVKAYLDLYIGPKIKGDFTFSNTITESPSLYSNFKDSKISISPLSIDIEVAGKGGLFGFETPKSLFFEGSLDLPLYREWYLFPEFSNLKIKKDNSVNTISVNTTPTRDILLSLGVGIGLYNQSGDLVSSQFEKEDYKRENEGYVVNQMFTGLTPNSTYIIRPMIKMFGIPFPAQPTQTFITDALNCSVNITSVKQIEAQYSKAAFSHKGEDYDFSYGTEVTVAFDEADNVEDWGYVYEDLNGDTAHVSLKTFASPYTDTRYTYYRNEPKSHATLYGYVKYVGDETFYHGEKTNYPLIYDKKPEATTLEPTFVDTQTAKIKCGYKEVAPWKGKCGVEYWYGSTDRNGIKTYFETADDEVEIPLNNLLPNTTYYYQAFIKVGEEYTEVFDGEYVWAVDDEGIKSFTTLPVVSFQTGEAKDIKETSALLTGTATGFDWTDERVKVAFYYSTEPDVINSTSGKSVTASYDENNGLSASLSGLCDYTTYYYTLGVKCGDHDVVYGEVCHFQTNPKVTTIENPTATNNSVTLQGTCSKGITIAGFSIMKDSDTEFTQYNVVPDEDGHFSVTIDNLDIETLYVYYAFVKANNQTITGNVYSFITRSILTICPDDHHPHMIDLGLPSGTKWACCNVGSSCPEEVGGYYAWGEVSEKSVYSPESQSLLDYFVYRGGGPEPIFKNVGNITATQYDAAYVNWGSRWQTPTVAQFQELINNCTSEMFKFVYNGKRGVIFTGPNGSKIFLRAGGYKYIQGGNASEYSNFCMYWTSTFSPAQTYSDEYYFYDAFSFFWYTLDNEARTLHHSIPIGLNIRPVAR